MNPAPKVPGLRIVAAGLGIAGLVTYGLTLAPTVTFVDSGELITVAQGLGVAHPPGVPLYTLLAHAATWLPVGNVAVRVHVASAVFAAGAVAMAALLSAALTLGASGAPVADALRHGRGRAKPRAAPSPRSEPPPNPRFALVAGGIGGLLFLFSRTLWSYATLAEVYTLNVLLLGAALWTAVRWRAEGRPPLLYCTAAALGLALAVHHVTAAIVGAGVAALVVTTLRRRPLARGVPGRALLCGSLGLLLYLYLPLAASASPVFNWGDPSTLERFWWHVSGRQYQVYFAGSLDTMVEQFRLTFIPYLAREFGPTWLPAAVALAVIGLARLWRRDRVVATALLLIVTLDLAYALNYDVAEDKDAYYLPVFLVLAVAAGIGAARVLEIAMRRSARLAWTAGALLVVVPAIACVVALPYTNRHDYHLAADYVRNVFTTISPRGALLTLDWQVYSPLLYMRHVEGFRPDTIAIDVNMLRRSWYFEYLRREFPELMLATEPRVSAFVDELREWERDPDLYERDLSRNRRINERFQALVTGLIETQLRSGPVYVTQDLLTQDPELASLLRPYTLVPQGLVFELKTTADFHPVADPELQLRGLFDGSIAFADDDVVRVKVAPAYLAMLVNRGRYLAAHGFADRANELYRRALALDPTFPATRESLPR